MDVGAELPTSGRARPSRSTTITSAPCRACRRAASFTPAGTTSCTARGGPFEPFDDSTFSILKDNGVYTHLASDHYHYWEDGGATYHHRYSSWQNVRGQEGDAWKGEVVDPDIPEHLGRINRQDWINRKYMREEKLTPQARTFAAGLEFLETNSAADNWYLQIENLRSARAVLHAQAMEEPLQL